MLRHPRGKKWDPVYEPPEWIQKCLHCEKKECTNCLDYAQRYESQRRMLAKLRESRKAERRAEKEKEWRVIEKMLDAGISARRITRILGKNENYFYSGVHAANYKSYQVKKKKEVKHHGNADRDTKAD